jgi:hypothetical protein
VRDVDNQNQHTQSNSLSHVHFTKHLLYMIENPPQKYDENQKKLEPLIRRLKNNTDFLTQIRTCCKSNENGRNKTLDSGS